MILTKETDVSAECEYMKTRIISGAVLIAITVAVLVTGNYFPIVLALFLAALAGFASFEILNNTGIVKNKGAIALAVGYSILAVLARCKALAFIWQGLTNELFALVLVLGVVVVALKNNSSFSVEKIAATIGLPIIISYAFSSLSLLYLRENGLFYLLLLLNFSSICDCGAYFTGVAIGKHKLCPNISPKKTIEGAVGGVVSSLIVSAILCLTMVEGKGLIVLLLSTTAFCVVGMCGDLFASVIKRNASIKDYGKLIPGHGGILDRFDSILLIAPVLLFFVEKGLF